MYILQNETTDFLIGYLLASMQTAGAIQPVAIIATAIAGLVSVVICLLLCWDLSKQSVDDTAVVGWVILFFVVPIISWIAYLLVVRLAK